MSTATLPDDPQIRARFGELKPALTTQAAVIEADRCLNCFDAPCTAACPTHIDVPGFIKRIASGNLRGSALRILDANILGAQLRARVPGGCAVRRRLRAAPAESQADPDRAVAAARHGCLLRDGRNAAGGRAWNAQVCAWHALAVGRHRWPAQRSCAARARALTVIERRALPGGLNTYGVAEYKLRAADSVREVELIRKLGVELRCGVEVDSAAALEALEKEFDSIFLGLGLGAMQRLNVPGEDAKGVMNALELIAAYKTGHLRELHGTVVVVGAGNTAIDAANAARRLGAEPVYLLYRRSENEISAFDFEYEHAKQEGVQFLWRRQPVAIRDDAQGRLLLDTVQVQQVDHQLLPLPNSQHTFDCDLVVPAIGQSPLAELLQELRGVEVRDGTIVADRATGQTGNPRYFAGGDCVNGGREVVDAVAGGKRAAIAILKAAEVTHA